MERRKITHKLKSSKNATSSMCRNFDVPSTSARPVWRSAHRFQLVDFPCSPTLSSSRISLGAPRLCSSQNSISYSLSNPVDESSFITQAVSHDTLSQCSNHNSDVYNVPFDNDVYSAPLDVVKLPIRPIPEFPNGQLSRTSRHSGLRRRERESRVENQRHSVHTSESERDVEPIHMSLQEVQQYLKHMYSDTGYQRKPITTANSINNNNNHIVYNHNNHQTFQFSPTKPNRSQKKGHTLLQNVKNKEIGTSSGAVFQTNNNINDSIIRLSSNEEKVKRGPARLSTLKQMIFNLFRFKKLIIQNQSKQQDCNTEQNDISRRLSKENNLKRALPPLPVKEEPVESNVDFATSIRRVKDCGWYWGPLSSEGAEKILSNEPDGAFIVRDSSDDHYIFSLTFKLNNCVRHVRIDHDQGNFSFGNCTRFKSHTIVDFIENAVEHSRSGRYLFFLHRRPVIGPVRVQLLHPVSRFKQVQSLQHICRFVILKAVRRDLVPLLPLPRRLIDYLNTPHYYSEHLVDIENVNESSTDETYNKNSTLDQNSSPNLTSNYEILGQT